jgi:DNA-binding transcriptional ArsR family regulator
MRALAHPTRLALLDHLHTLDQATATECAVVVGDSPSSCSYHLRALAKWGLVEETEGSDRRERRWQVLTPLVIGDHDGPRGPDVVAAEHALTAEILNRSTTRVLDWLDASDDEPREWHDVQLVSSRNIIASAAELAAVLAEIDALLTPLVASSRRDNAPADARLVHVHLSAVPKVGA